MALRFETPSYPDVFDNAFQTARFYSTGDREFRLHHMISYDYLPKNIPINSDSGMIYVIPTGTPVIDWVQPED